MVLYPFFVSNLKNLNTMYIMDILTYTQIFVTQCLNYSIHGDFSGKFSLKVNLDLKNCKCVFMITV